MVIEATGWRPEDQVVLNLLSKDAKNVILAINKTDEVKESEAMLPLIKESMEKFHLPMWFRSAPKRPVSWMFCLT